MQQTRQSQKMDVMGGPGTRPASHGKLMQVLNDAAMGRTPVNESLRSVHELMSSLNF